MYLSLNDSLSSPPYSAHAWPQSSIVRFARVATTASAFFDSVATTLLVAADLPIHVSCIARRVGLGRSEFNQLFTTLNTNYECGKSAVSFLAR